MQLEPAINAKDKISLAILNDEIVEAKYKIHRILPILLEGDAKVEHDNKLRTYSEIIVQLYNQPRQ